MKLAVLAFVLGLSGVAAADELGPVDPYQGPPPAVAPIAPVAPDAGPPPVMLKGQRRGQRGQLKQLLLAKFDRNHDGRLEPRERMRAAKVLHRLANRLANNQGRMQGQQGRMQGQQGRQLRRQKFIRKYDLNGDGNVGPGEMPPALGAEMQPLDRNGDGWLSGNELP